MTAAPKRPPGLSRRSVQKVGKGLLIVLVIARLLMNVGSAGKPLQSWEGCQPALWQRVIPSVAVRPFSWPTPIGAGSSWYGVTLLLLGQYDAP
jgi:hypothetical protein